MLDIIIKNGTIVDGTGGSRYKCDVGIRNGKIDFIGYCESEAKTVIDAKGFLVTPGFIDFHSHSDCSLLYETRATNMLMQGITTEITGNCGITLTPKVDEIFSMIRPYVDEKEYEYLGKVSETVEGFMSCVEKKPLGTNLTLLIGHGAIRGKVLGYDNRKATENELEKMKDIMREAMESGALGLSTGLIYPPGVYADEDELLALCKIVAEYGGIYVTHMRSEGDRIIESMKEALRIGEKAGVPVVISHHKILGKQNWGKSEETLELIEDANKKGIKVRLDQYPYKAGAAGLLDSLPPKYASGGPAKFIEKLKNDEIRKEIKQQLLSNESDFENLIYGSGLDGVLIVNAKNTKKFVGKTILQISKELNKDPYETIFDLVLDNEGYVDAAYFMMDDEDIERIIGDSFVMGGTDAMYLNEKIGSEHPRCVGTFVKILSTYIRDKKIVALEEGIRKLTSLPAETAGLKGKGMLKEGYDADILVLDYENLKSNSDFSNPGAPNEGIKYVLVNGEIAVKDDSVTGICAGKLIRKI